jgi:hypothetical protein
MGSSKVRIGAFSVVAVKIVQQPSGLGAIEDVGDRVVKTAILRIENIAGGCSVSGLLTRGIIYNNDLENVGISAEGQSGVDCKVWPACTAGGRFFVDPRSRICGANFLFRFWYVAGKQ